MELFLCVRTSKSAKNVNDDRRYSSRRVVTESDRAFTASYLEIHGLPGSGIANQICGANIRGGLELEDNAARIVIGSASDGFPCLGNTIGGNVEVQNNRGPILALTTRSPANWNVNTTSRLSTDQIPLDRQRASVGQGPQAARMTVGTMVATAEKTSRATNRS
jgi:hypothetical protein